MPTNWRRPPEGGLFNTHICDAYPTHTERLYPQRRLSGECQLALKSSPINWRDRAGRCRPNAIIHIAAPPSPRLCAFTEVTSQGFRPSRLPKIFTPWLLPSAYTVSPIRRYRGWRI
jgi:hypothetical protein